MAAILFVCHGNICRSPMAEFVMKDVLIKRGLSAQFVVASAATSTEALGCDIHRGTQATLRNAGIPFARRAAVQLTREDYARYDFLIGMDSQNIRNMLRICGGDPEGKIHRLLDYTARPGDVADPWYTGDFSATWRDVLEGCTAILHRYTACQ